MKAKSVIWWMTVVLTLLLCAKGEVQAGWMVLFTGSAAAIDWTELRAHQRRTGRVCFMAPGLVATLPVVHEDLSDAMVLLEPEEMLFTSAAPKGPAAENIVFRAPLDKLDQPRLGGQMDGQKINRSNVTNRQANRSQVFGTIQHVRETYGNSLVSQKVMNPAGVKDVVGDSKFKTLLALKEKMELTFLSDQDSAEISGSAAGLTRGAIMWGRSSAQPNSAFAVPTAFLPSTLQDVYVSGGMSGITEAMFEAMLLQLRIARHRKVDCAVFTTLDGAKQFRSFFKEETPAEGAVATRHFNYDGEADEYEQMVMKYSTYEGSAYLIPTAYLNGLQSSAPGLTGTTTSGSAVITTLANVPLDDDGNSALQPFSLISGTGIPAGAYIVSVDSSTQITISANCTANGSAVALTLGQQTHMFFTDLKYWEVRTNLAPGHVPLPNDSGAIEGYCEAIVGLFCTYPALLGRFYT